MKGDHDARNSWTRYHCTTFSNKAGAIQAEVNGALAKVATALTNPSAPGMCVGLAGPHILAMCSDESGEWLKFLENFVENPASLYMDITLKEVDPRAILVRTWEEGPTAAKIYPALYIAEDGTVENCLNNACVPNDMACTAVEISVRSAQEALKRLQELGGVAYAQSRGASNLPLGQVQAGVARTQAALQSLTQLAQSVKSR